MKTPHHSTGREPARLHTISIHSAYGEVLDTEQVQPAELPAALRRFHNRAMSHSNTVVVLDGVTHSRNSFLEFVREFNEFITRRRLGALAS
jgi:hypothetical protein